MVYFPLNCGIIVYVSEIFPVIPVNGVLTSSLCCGSKTSNAFGNSGFGNWNNFKLPFPDAVTTKSNDSPAFNCDLDAFTVKSKAPTAPVKFSGFPFSGNAFTLIDLAPAETVFLVVS